MRPNLRNRPASARVPSRYFVYRVVFSRHDIQLPYFRHCLPPGFPRTRAEVWIKERQQRDLLLRLDPQATSEKYEARRCQRCGRWALGIQAQIMRERELCARMNNEEIPLCCSDCTTRSET